MEGSSQGSGYPGHRQTHLVSVSRQHRVTCGNAGTSCACRGREIGDHRVCRHRQRVRFSDAEIIRERVESHASQLRLRGARRHVLAAVLKLLCGWSRIADDRVGLPQIVELIAERGERRYDLKTIGRALAGLAADELIVYRPAQGRGARAMIAIHDRFVADIEVLQEGPCRAGHHRPQRRFRHLFGPLSL